MENPLDLRIVPLSIERKGGLHGAPKHDIPFKSGRVRDAKSGKFKRGRPPGAKKVKDQLVDTTPVAPHSEGCKLCKELTPTMALAVSAWGKYMPPAWIVERLSGRFTLMEVQEHIYSKYPASAKQETPLDLRQRIQLVEAVALDKLTSATPNMLAGILIECLKLEVELETAISGQFKGVQINIGEERARLSDIRNKFGLDVQDVTPTGDQIPAHTIDAESALTGEQVKVVTSEQPAYVVEPEGDRIIN